MHGESWWPMGWMGFWWIFLLLVILAAVSYAVSAARGSDAMGASAENILKRRYADGEIDRETYERMLDDLRK